MARLDGKKKTWTYDQLHRQTVPTAQQRDKARQSTHRDELEAVSLKKMVLPLSTNKVVQQCNLNSNTCLRRTRSRWTTFRRSTSNKVVEQYNLNSNTYLRGTRSRWTTFRRSTSNKVVEQCNINSNTYVRRTRSRWNAPRRSTSRSISRRPTWQPGDGD